MVAYLGMPNFQRHVFVCVNERPEDDPRGSCLQKGGAQVRDRFKAELKSRGVAKLVRANNAGCLDQCARGVTVVVYPEQVWYGGVTVDDVTEIVEKHLIGGEVVERLLMPDQPQVEPKRRLPVLKTGVVLAVLALGGARARAEEARPDPLAQSRAEEANLESNAPRQGVTFSAAVGGGLLLGKGTVGSMPMLSLRVGEVMTPNSILTLELVGGTVRHKQAMDGPTLTDATSSLLVGAQYYTNTSLWVRGGGGLNVHSVDNGPQGSSVVPGVAAAIGAGVDLLRRHFFVLGLEVLSIAAVDRDGLLLSGGLSLGASYY
jgi:(2Fe-2S) ferredoxin